MILDITTAVALSLTLAWALIALLRTAAWTERLEDRPNDRSLHVEPRRRVGGIGVMLAALSVAAFAADVDVGVILACAAALAVLSGVDDVRSLPIEVRLSAHFAAAAVATWAVGAWQLSPIFILAAVLSIAWMANLFNFMDGSDGLAGGMATIGFAALAFRAADVGAGPTALACAAVAAASAGFLLHNFPPARVFLGDAGSIPLGFLAGAFGVQGAIAGTWRPWFPLIVLSPFITDATLTLMRRALRREPVLRAHRSHLYQRLVLAGWSHRRLALHAYALMLLVAVAANVAQRAGPRIRFGILIACAAGYLLLFLLAGRYCATRGLTPPAAAGTPGRA